MPKHSDIAQDKALIRKMVPTAKKDGGRMCKAVGGVAKIRHKQATPAGKPMAAPRRFKNGGLI